MLRSPRLGVKSGVSVHMRVQGATLPYLCAHACMCLHACTPCYLLHARAHTPSIPTLLAGSKRCTQRMCPSSPRRQPCCPFLLPLQALLARGGGAPLNEARCPQHPGSAGQGPSAAQLQQKKPHLAVKGLKGAVWPSVAAGCGGGGIDLMLMPCSIHRPTSSGWRDSHQPGVGRAERSIQMGAMRSPLPTARIPAASSGGEGIELSITSGPHIPRKHGIASPQCSPRPPSPL